MDVDATTSRPRGPLTTPKNFADELLSLVTAERDEGLVDTPGVRTTSRAATAQSDSGLIFGRLVPLSLESRNGGQYKLPPQQRPRAGF